MITKSCYQIFCVKKLNNIKMGYFLLDGNKLYRAPLARIFSKIVSIIIYLTIVLNYHNWWWEWIYLKVGIMLLGTTEKPTSTDRTEVHAYLLPWRSRVQKVLIKWQIVWISWFVCCVFPFFVFYVTRILRLHCSALERNKVSEASKNNNF